MSSIQILHLATGGLVEILLCLFIWSSLGEMKMRAAVAGIALAAAFGAAWSVAYAAFSESALLLALPSAFLVLAAVLYFLPVGPGRVLRADKITGRVDERDVLFSREEYRPGPEQYEIYYAMHPENKEVDDKLRLQPELLAPGGRFYDPVKSEHVNGVFRILEGMLTGVDGEVASKQVPFDPLQATRTFKALAFGLGADEVGIAKLNPQFVYSNVGRGPEPFGASIVNHHQYAIAFSLEMDYTHVEAAPRLDITVETATRYLAGAQISIALARCIRSHGYPARAHIAGSNYQVMLPPVARDAGLGELGRMGYLISPRFGARTRLGLVTTDLPLVPDRPIAFGVQDFCEKCLKCAINCPSGAIPRGDPVEVRGVEKWPLHVEKCLHYWRMIGTDCGLCMKVCPFSHPPTLIHNLVRAGIKRSPIARTLSVWGDDLLYGRRTGLVRDEVR